LEKALKHEKAPRNETAAKVNLVTYVGSQRGMYGKVVSDCTDHYHIDEKVVICLSLDGLLLVF